MAVEEWPAIERSGLVQFACLHKPFERDGVHCDHRCVEADRIVIGSQRRRLVKRAPQLGQGLAETGPRLLVAAVAPQERHQLLPRPWLSWGERKAAEQRAHLPAQRPRVAPMARPQLETAE